MDKVLGLLIKAYSSRADLKERAIKKMLEDPAFLEQALKTVALQAIETGEAVKHLEQFLTEAMNSRDWATVREIALALEEIESVVTVTETTTVDEDVFR